MATPRSCRRSLSQETRTLKAAAGLSIPKAGEKGFKPGKNILCIQISGPDIIKEPTELAFLGYGISEPESGWNDLEGIDLKNKIPVLMLGAPTENGKPVLPEKLHKSYLSVPGAEKKVTKLALMGITRIVFIADDEISQMWPMLPRAMANSVVTMEGSARRGPANMVISVINKKVASHLFSGQEYNPFDKAEGSQAGYKSFVLKDATIQLKAEAKEENIETWNVVGMIPGKDTKLKDEFVVIGGHLDHVPPVNGEVCNGADDNASGSIGVIETAEALAMQDNKRSILVCLWAAEEVGLYGSSWFVNHPPVNVDQMKVNINLDMIARTDAKNSKNRAIWALGSNRANPAFKKFIQDVNKKLCKLASEYDRQWQGPGRQRPRQLLTQRYTSPILLQRPPPGLPSTH
jgi:Zn-dependent M28 family amino/carboxypeptidase